MGLIIILAALGLVFFLVFVFRSQSDTGPKVSPVSKGQRSDHSSSIDDLIIGYEIIVTPDIRTRLHVLKLRNKVYDKEEQASLHDFYMHEAVILPKTKSWQELGIELDEMDYGSQWTDIGEMNQSEIDLYFQFLEEFRTIIEDSLIPPVKKIEKVRKMIDPNNFLPRLHKTYGDDFPAYIFLKELAEIEGISIAIAKNMFKMNIYSKDELLNMSFEELTQIDGVGKKRANQIVSHIKNT